MGVRNRRNGRKVSCRLVREEGRLLLRTLEPPRVERQLVGNEEMQIEGAVVFFGRGV